MVVSLDESAPFLSQRIFPDLESLAPEKCSYGEEIELDKSAV